MTVFTTDVVGYMSSNDFSAIETLAKQVPVDGLMVEVGSLMGRSTTCWATFCDPTVQIIAIDEFPEEVMMYVDEKTKEQKLLWSFDPDYDSIKNNVKPQVDRPHDNIPLLNKPYRIHDEFKKNTAQFTNVRHIKGKSPDNINYTGEKIDLFFLDAAHKNPSDWDNIKFFAKYMNVGGIICGHDWFPEDTYPDVNKNIKDLERIYETTAVKFEGTNVWSIQVTKHYDEVSNLFGN